MLAAIAGIIVIAAVAVVLYMLNSSTGQVQVKASQDSQVDSAVQAEQADGRPPYITKYEAMYRSDGELVGKTETTLTENGETLKTEIFTASTSEWETIDYKDIGGGVTIPSDEEGSYEMDANGDVTTVTSYEVGFESHADTIGYEYYRPGVVKKITRSTNGGFQQGGIESYIVYDEDGWVIETYSKSHVVDEGEYEFNRAREEHEYCVNEFSNDGRTVIRKVYSTPERSGEPIQTIRLELDENGNVVRQYLKAGTPEEYLYQEFSRQEAEGDVPPLHSSTRPSAWISPRGQFLISRHNDEARIPFR